MNRDAKPPVSLINDTPEEQQKSRFLTYPWPTMASCFMLGTACIRSKIVSPGGTWALAGAEYYSLAHAQHPVNLGDTKPVEDVGHQGLEAHILDTCDVFGSLEIVRCTILPAFSGVVHNCDPHYLLDKTPLGMISKETEGWKTMLGSAASPAL